VIANLIEEMV